MKRTFFFFMLIIFLIPEYGRGQNDTSKFTLPPLTDFKPLKLNLEDYIIAALPDVDATILSKAAAGDAESQYEVGLYWSENVFLKYLLPDENGKALTWFEKAAAQGHKEAAAEAGINYYIRCIFSSGIEQERNKQQSLYYLKLGGAEEDPTLMMFIAHLLIIKDTTNGLDALMWCDNAIKKGLPLGKENLSKSRQTSFVNCTLGGAYDFKAGVYRHGEGGVQKDTIKYFENLVLSAKNGYRNALVSIGECYFLGWGVSQDQQKAIEIWNSLKDDSDDVIRNRVIHMEEKYLISKTHLKDEKDELREWLEENR